MKNYFNNFKYLMSYAWRKNKSLLIIVLFKSLFTAIIPMINISGIGIIVDALVSKKGNNEIAYIVILYLSVNLIISILSNVLTYMDNCAMRKSSDDLQLDYARNSVCIDYHYAQDGSMLNLKKRSMISHPAWFLYPVGELFNYIVQLISVVYIFSALSPLFLLVVVLSSFISIFVSLKMQNLDFKFNNEKVDEDRILDYLYTVMSDNKFQKEIRINKGKKYISSKYSTLQNDQIIKYRMHISKKSMFNTIKIFVTAIQTAVMYLYFSYQVSISAISLGEYTVLLGATTLFANVFISSFNILGKIKNTLKYTDLFKKYTDFVKDNSKIYDSNKMEMPDICLNNITISFENVSFTYPNTEKTILKNINFTIKQGERIGLVGLNGSGKTTLIKLLCRLYDPNEGRIMINKVDIKNIPHDKYSKIIGIVLQDFKLFAYSVKENIVFDGIVNESRLVECMKKSDIYERVSKLPKGMDTSIYKTLDDEGVELSGGEGQKLSIAKAVYKQPNVMILDEPTSAMDPVAEYNLFSKLSEISDNKTVIFISHRLSSTQFCDRIFVVSDGRIAEIGNHKELMEMGGIYKELFISQAKYYQMEN